VRTHNPLIFAGVHAGAVVVDATPAVLAIHQNHAVAAPGDGGAARDAEFAENTRLTGRCGFGCDDSTHVLTADGIRLRDAAPIRRRVERGIAHYPYMRPLLGPLLLSLRALSRARRDS
jgi:hypothetical protein